MLMSGSGLIGVNDFEGASLRIFSFHIIGLIERPLTNDVD
jgi:hypothetical protein